MTIRLHAADASTVASDVEPPPISETQAGRADTRRLFDNVAALAGLQVANFVLPLVTIPYLTRVLGPQRFGLVAFAQAGIQYLVILTDFGFNISATRSISMRRQEPERVAETFASVLVLKVLLAILSGILLAAAVAFAPSMKSEWRLFLYAYGLVIGNVLFPVWYFLGMERMRFVAILTMLAKAIFTGLVFVFVRAEPDYTIVPLLSSVGAIVAGIISLWVAAKRLGLTYRWPTTQSVFESLKESVGYFASRISVTIYTASNVFFLGLAATPFEVGLYSSAEKIYGAMQGVYSPVTTALMPYMARTRNKSLFLRILVTSSVVNAGVCIALVIFAGPVVRVAFGPDYAGASRVLSILALATIFVIPTFLLGYPLLAAFGHAKQANGSAIAGSVLHLVGLATLAIAGELHPVTVATLVLITESIVLLLRVRGVYKARIWSVAGTR